MLPAKSTSESSWSRARQFLLRYGFEIVLIGVVLFYTLSAPRFLTATNIIGLLHAAAPLMVIAAGLSLVVMMGKLDISVGSTAFLTTSVGTILMVRQGVDPVLTLVIVLALGALIGALNGFIVVVLRINPLITTLGTMIGLRGIGLELTKSTNISLPEEVRRLGNATLGPIFVDILIALAIMAIIHLIHRRTAFGRQIMAIGNDADTAARLGVRVPRVTFFAFVVCGLLAAIGGVLTVVQVGAVSGSIGSGLEFTAVSVIVIGGISLFGGEGSILPGALRGVLMLEIIRNGLNHLGADPYAYRFVNGAIIFIAMYADSLRAQVPVETHAFEAEEAPTQPQTQTT
jgi:ribose/xylose/arabinose/galactoside ABC-type transport system permease subunit